MVGRYGFASLPLFLLKSNRTKWALYDLYYLAHSACSNVHVKMFTEFSLLFFFLFSEHVDIDEAKSIYETNYSHVYFILYDTFVQAETNLKQKGWYLRCRFNCHSLITVEY